MEDVLATLESVAKKYKVTLDQVKKLRSVMSNTWQAIGSDCADACADDRKALKAVNDEKGWIIAELTLDAGRHKDYGNDAETSAWISAYPGDLLALGTAAWDARN